MRISDWSSDVCSSDLRTGPRMGVLDVEDRIVLRLFDDLGEIEIELRVGPPREHDEAHDVLADFLTHIGPRHEIARALRHQIDRASCRESVCKYVSISVVAV